MAAKKTKKLKKPKVHVRKGDRVEVKVGKDKGMVEEVIEVFPRENKIRVKDVNMLTKHQKPTQQNQQGGIIQVEGKIDASNVLLYCDHCGRGVRYGKRINEDGTKTRVCKRCGNSLDV